MTDAKTRAVFCDYIRSITFSGARRQPASCCLLGCRRQGHGADLLREPDLTPSRPRSVGLRPALRAVYLGRPAFLPRLREPLQRAHQAKA